MVQVEVKKEIILVVDEKEIKLTEEQAKKLLDSLKVILEPSINITVSTPEPKEPVYIPYPVYPTNPYPNYPWIVYGSETTIEKEIVDKYTITC